MSNNHVIDPLYFYDCIDEFSFNYTIYIVDQTGVDDYGNLALTYSQNSISGSLQIQNYNLQQSKSGNTNDVKYKFYCKSLYRINIGDIIEYQNNYLRVNAVMPYDEYGVRECDLTMIKLTGYRDFSNYISYLKGELIV